jgi:hypothetical protein
MADIAIFRSVKDWTAMNSFEQAFYLINIEIWNDIIDSNMDAFKVAEDCYPDLIKAFRQINHNVSESVIKSGNTTAVIVMIFSYFLGRAGGAGMIPDFNKQSLNDIEERYDEMAKKMLTGIRRITESYMA